MRKWGAELVIGRAGGTRQSRLDGTRESCVMLELTIPNIV